ncbi:MAG TPA: phosphopantetheine-binding protein [Kineosporiaceae bacterium]
MGESEVLDVVRRTTVQVLPEVLAESVTLDGRLSDLGANSIDRMEIVALSMEELGLVISPTEFAQVKDVRSLVAVLTRHAAGRP